MSATGTGTTRLRILQLLTHGSIKAGGSIQAFLLGRELVRRGHSVDFVLHARHGEADPDARARIEGIGAGFLAMSINRVTAVPALARTLKEGRYDVVHLHREGALQRFLQAAPFAPEVVAIANVGTSKPPSSALARRFRSKRIDRIVVVAEALRKLLVRAADVDPSRIATIYGAFDEEVFREEGPPADRAALGVPEGAKLVGVVANVDAKKGHDVFLRAAAKVATARADVHFVCAGKGDADALRRKASGFGLDVARLHLPGFVRDVPALLRALDVSVSASTHGEGLTGALRESMAMGVPVVTTALAGNVEVVRHRETGLLVPVRDPDALAAALLEALGDPEAARARAARGRERVRAEMTSAGRAARMEALYLDAVAMRAARRSSIEDILTPGFEA